MHKSTTLTGLLEDLSRYARERGLTDTQWSEQAGVRKETLSRLRRRRTCDLATLEALGRVVGARLHVFAERPPRTSGDGHFPEEFGRSYEAELLRLCSSRALDPARWLALGPPYFMAGLALLVSSMRGFDRRRLVALAEGLHPGISEPVVFDRWLQRSPLQPSRFLPQLEAGDAHAA